MQEYERAEMTDMVRLTVNECFSDWIVCGVVLIVFFMMILGSTCSFWLGVLVGLSIPYYIIPHYFCHCGDSL